VTPKWGCLRESQETLTPAIAPFPLGAPALPMGEGENIERRLCRHARGVAVKAKERIPVCAFDAFGSCIADLDNCGNDLLPSARVDGRVRYSAGLPDRAGRLSGRQHRGLGRARTEARRCAATGRPDLCLDLIARAHPRCTRLAHNSVILIILIFPHTLGNP
jgi:hypothetical protein